jgi:glycosyltransferase involved in cell wall biosynthesis
MVCGMIQVAFVIFQGGKLADGGVRSISLIIDRLHRLGRVRPLIVTNAETPQTATWRAAGHEVLVWSWSHDGRAGRREGALLRRGRRVTDFITSNTQMVRLVRERGIRVIHCNDHPALWTAAPGARLAGARVVSNLRDTLGVRGPKWKMSRILSDRLVVLSDEMKSYVETVLPRPRLLPGSRFAPVERIYSLVDLEQMSPLEPAERALLRRRLGIEEQTFAIAVVAAFVAKKQQLGLIRHLAAHPGSIPRDGRFYFVGDFSPDTDAYCRACQAEAGSEALADRLRFVGYTPAVRDWYRAADVILVPSREEGLARCMIEGLACGTPVVSFDVCSAREILEGGGCGSVVPQGDYPDLLAALSRLQGDAPGRARLGRAGAELARRRFAPPVVAEAYARVYEGLAARSGPGEHQ